MSGMCGYRQDVPLFKGRARRAVFALSSLLALGLAGVVLASMFKPLHGVCRVPGHYDLDWFVADGYIQIIVDMADDAPDADNRSSAYSPLPRSEGPSEMASPFSQVRTFPGFAGSRPYYRSAPPRPATQKGLVWPDTLSLHPPFQVGWRRPVGGCHRSYLRASGWLVVALTSALPAFMLTSVSWRRRGRLRRKECLACAYNLSGNVSGVCPECGAKATPIPRGAAP
jgi:hypothetical protein